jgi:hypothetical protein
MNSSVKGHRKRNFKTAIAVFLFTVIVVPWFGLFYFGTQFCTAVIFSNRLPCLESLVNIGKLFAQPIIGVTFVYLHFGIGSLVLALILAPFFYFRGRIGWRLPLVFATLACVKQATDVFELLWRIDIKDAQHARYVFGTAILDALYVSFLVLLFWFLMNAVIFGFKNDPHHT